MRLKIFQKTTLPWILPVAAACVGLPLYAFGFVGFLSVWLTATFLWFAVCAWSAMPQRERASSPPTGSAAEPTSAPAVATPVEVPHFGAASTEEGFPVSTEYNIRWARLRGAVPPDLFDKLLAVGVAAIPFERRFGKLVPDIADPLKAIQLFSTDTNPLSVWSEYGETGMVHNKDNWSRIVWRATTLSRDPKTRALVRALMDAFTDERWSRAMPFKMLKTFDFLEEWLHEEEATSGKAQAWLAQNRPDVEQTQPGSFPDDAFTPDDMRQGSENDGGSIPIAADLSQADAGGRIAGRVIWAIPPTGVDRIN